MSDIDTLIKNERRANLKICAQVWFFEIGGDWWGRLFSSKTPSTVSNLSKIPCCPFCAYVYKAYWSMTSLLMTQIHITEIANLGMFPEIRILVIFPDQDLFSVLS